MKTKVNIKSVFEQIAEQVFQMTNLNEAKTFTTEFINGKNIKEEDKKTILRQLDDIKTIVKFQTYICNSLLKYEGMSVNLK
jgi:hypothetical protein